MRSGARIAWQAAALAVLAAGMRLQHAPVAPLPLGSVYVRTDRRLLLVAAAALLLRAVGVLDGLSWGGGLFHSYFTNVRFNLALGRLRVGDSLPHQFLWWLTLASGGLSVAPLALGLATSPRRYVLLIVVVALVLIRHSLQFHKEYRFILAVNPLRLLIGAGVTVPAAQCAAARPAPVPGSRWIRAATGAIFAALSAARQSSDHGFDQRPATTASS